MKLRVITHGDKDFNQYWDKGLKSSDIVHPFYSSILKTYDARYLGDSLVSDDSFVLIEETGKIRALVPLYRCEKNDSFYYGYLDGYFLAPLVLEKEASRLHSKILEVCCNEIQRLAIENKVSTHRAYFNTPTVVRGTYYSNPLTVFGYTDENCEGLVLSLIEDESIIRGRLRKSYKPLINKATRNFDVVIVDENNYDLDLCEEYRKLHYLSAGRETRAWETFQLQYQLIENSQGYLVLIREFEKTLGAYFFYQLNDTVFYASASTLPECGTQSGVGHLGLWKGITKAKERGAKYMDFGLLSVDNADLKFANINFFKCGFGGRKAVVFRGAKTFPSKIF